MFCVLNKVLSVTVLDTGAGWMAPLLILQKKKKKKKKFKRVGLLCAYVPDSEPVF